MKDFLLFFFGNKNIYFPTYKGKYRYFPDILTVRWWRWCLAHGPRLARERVRYYYIRKFRYRILMLPICWVKGHDLYDSSSWGYTCQSCSRCHNTFNFKRYGFYRDK